MNLANKTPPYQGFPLFSSRKDQNLLSPVNCWYLLLNQVSLVPRVLLMKGGVLKKQLIFIDSCPGEEGE